MRLARQLLIIAGVAMTLAACSPPPAQTAQSDKQKTGTQSMTVSVPPLTQTLCIGRFLIGLPANTSINLGTAKTYEAGKIERTPRISLDEFEKRMHRREQELRALAHNTEGTRLKEVMRDPVKHSRIFLYRESEVASRTVEIHGYLWRDNQMFTFESGADNEFIAVGKQDMVRAMTSLKIRDNRTIPNEPGFCIDGALLPGKEFRFENVGASFEFSDYPGFIIGFGTRATDRPVDPDERLIARVLRSDKLASPDEPPEITIRQTGKRQVAGLFAEELVRKFKSTKVDAMFMLGYAEHYPQPGRLDQPEITLRFELDPADPVTGQRHANLPSEEAVLALWDAILDSLRLRPGAL